MKNKTAKKLHNIGSNLIIYSFVFNILESIYFGWNAKALSTAEMVCDKIASYGITLGFILVLIPAVNLYSNYIDNLEDEL